MPRLAAIFLCCALFARVLGAENAPDAPLGSDEKGFRRLFLESGDLPIGMHLKKQTLSVNADAADAQYLICGGLRAGIRAWNAESASSVMWRMVDIRLAFPDEDAATRYLHASLEYLSAGSPSYATAALVGQEPEMFGPDSPAAKALGVDSRAFTLVFRERNIVVKIFVVQGADASDPLEASMVAKLGSVAVRRISGE